MNQPNKEIADLLDELDPPYNNLEELRIGRMLDRYGIPFFYQQPTLVYRGGKEKILEPSFNLFSYGGTIIDYLPQAKRERRLEKAELYHYNFIPAVLLGPKDLEKANWDRVHHRLPRTEFPWVPI